MAEFSKAYCKTCQNEGGFAYNPADSGRMTYKGISRRYHSKWQGWVVIDRELASMKSMPPYGTDEYDAWVRRVNIALKRNAPLQQMILVFYQTNFWGQLSAVKSQAVADWVYDHAVNGGGQGAIWAQLACGATPDGEIGPKTIAAINRMDPEKFLERAGDIAGAYRLDRACAKPSQIEFLHSWLVRDGQPQEIIDMVAAAVVDGRLDNNEVEQVKVAMRQT